jgi:hypothetical protein
MSETLNSHPQKKRQIAAMFDIESHYGLHFLATGKGGANMAGFRREVKHDG